MILTTTPTIEGRSIAQYKGVVFGEVVAGVNFLRDIRASIRNFIGGRSGSYEEELIQARTQALNEMSERAAQLGADAVVGIDLDYEVLGENGGILPRTRNLLQVTYYEGNRRSLPSRSQPTFQCGHFHRQPRQLESCAMA